jgi:hypothetical protein
MTALQSEWSQALCFSALPAAALQLACLAAYLQEEKCATRLLTPHVTSRWVQEQHASKVGELWVDGAEVGLVPESLSSSLPLCFLLGTLPHQCAV